MKDLQIENYSIQNHPKNSNLLIYHYFKVNFTCFVIHLDHFSVKFAKLKKIVFVNGHICKNSQY